MQYHVSFDISFLENTYNGQFIVLEGIDGSGKSTQKNIIQKEIEKKGKKTLLTHEPTREGHIGKLVHEILQSEVLIPLVGLQYLFAADRSVHQEHVLIPALQEGKTVISERCFWSAVPYGLADKEHTDYKNASESMLAAYSLLSMYNQFILPDKTFFLDVTPQTAVKRLAAMSKEKEIYEKKSKLEIIYQGYKFLLDKFPDQFIVIDGEASQEKITEAILSNL